MDGNSTSRSSFLLEIGTEDLPARFIHPAMQQLRDSTERMLAENHIEFTEVKTYGTPRRLAVIADGIPQMQKDRIREVLGPSKKVAFDKDGKHTMAAIGFARSQGIDVEHLQIKHTDRGEYVAAVIDAKGVHVSEILPEILKRIVLSIHLPKSMRWGDRNIRFARPIRWFLALFDKEIISFEIDGIQSGNLTKGHRFLSPASFQIREIPSYKKLLGNNSVIIDPEERKRIILEQMESLLAVSGEKPVRDDELLDTVVNLVEYPVPVIASFPEEYLKLPEELLITVMKGHQKYFGVQDNKGSMTNHFVVISNTSEGNSETVKVGAERVIKARFEDARFYYEEDTKRRLSDRVEELRKVTFQENLGSIYDKTLRLVAIAEFFADRLLPEAKNSILRAAKLAKADLITGVVREFPELQGIMGKYYALHSGEGREVAEALEEQYLPSHSGGALPRTDAGAVISMADKIDSIAAFFSIGLVPTGSEDPFALRRQALGIIAILFDKGYNLPLENIIEKALGVLLNVSDYHGTRDAIYQFFKVRLETVLSDKGYSNDLIQSILPLSLRIELKDILARLEAVNRFREDSRCDDFLSAVKRVYNILPKTSIPGLKNELLYEESERKLKENIDSVRTQLPAFLDDRRYYDAIILLSTLTEPVNTFFDTVLVMDKREEVKQNRFALLKELWDTLSAVADFSKLSAVQ